MLTNNERLSLLMDRAGLNSDETAQLFGYSDGASIRRIVTGDRDIRGPQDKLLQYIFQGFWSGFDRVGIPAYMGRQIKDGFFLTRNYYPRLYCIGREKANKAMRAAGIDSIEAGGKSYDFSVLWVDEPLHFKDKVLEKTRNYIYQLMGD